MKTKTVTKTTLDTWYEKIFHLDFDDFEDFEGFLLYLDKNKSERFFLDFNAFNREYGNSSGMEDSLETIKEKITFSFFFITHYDQADISGFVEIKGGMTFLPYENKVHTVICTLLLYLVSHSDLIKLEDINFMRSKFLLAKVSFKLNTFYIFNPHNYQKGDLIISRTGVNECIGIIEEVRMFSLAELNYSFEMVDYDHFEKVVQLSEDTKNHWKAIKTKPKSYQIVSYPIGYEREVPTFATSTMSYNTWGKVLVKRRGAKNSMPFYIIGSDSFVETPLAIIDEKKERHKEIFKNDTLGRITFADFKTVGYDGHATGNHPLSNLTPNETLKLLKTIFRLLAKIPQNEIVLKNSDILLSARRIIMGLIRNDGLWKTYGKTSSFFDFTVFILLLRIEEMKPGVSQFLFSLAEDERISIVYVNSMGRTFKIPYPGDVNMRGETVIFYDLKNFVGSYGYIETVKKVSFREVLTNIEEYLVGTILFLDEAYELATTPPLINEIFYFEVHNNKTGLMSLFYSDMFPPRLGSFIEHKDPVFVLTVPKLVDKDILDSDFMLNESDPFFINNYDTQKH